MMFPELHLNSAETEIFCNLKTMSMLPARLSQSSPRTINDMHQVERRSLLITEEFPILPANSFVWDGVIFDFYFEHEMYQCSGKCKIDNRPKLGSFFKHFEFLIDPETLKIIYNESRRNAAKGVNRFDQSLGEIIGDVHGISD